MEIRRDGILKGAENLEFRRYLEAHHQRVEAFQSVATDVQAHIDCTRCANCCRCSVVSVGGAEIARVAAYIDIDEERVVERFSTPDAESPKARILKTCKDGCVFLKGNLCGIYAARPRSVPQFSTYLDGNEFARGANVIRGPLGSALPGALQRVRTLQARCRVQTPRSVATYPLARTSSAFFTTGSFSLFFCWI